MGSVTFPVPRLVKSDGTVQVYEDGKGFTLANGTYFLAISDFDAPWGHLSLSWDGVIAFTAQMEDSSLPRKLGKSLEGGDTPATDVSVVNGNWIVWPMPATQVSVIATDASTGGATYTAGTGVLAVVAGTVGGASIKILDEGAARLRYKIVVTTPGKLWPGLHRKSAG